MGYRFRRCVDRTACTEDGERCRACGRSHEEIASIRTLTSQVSEFLQLMDYENSEEFLDYLKAKALKKYKRAK